MLTKAQGAADAASTKCEVCGETDCVLLGVRRSEDPQDHQARYARHYRLGYEQRGQTLAMVAVALGALLYAARHDWECDGSALTACDCGLSEVQEQANLALHAAERTAGDAPKEPSP